MKAILAKLAQGLTLSTDEAVDAFEQIMTGSATPAQIGALLSMIALRGPTVDEITGAARVMRAKATPVAVPEGLTVIDTCGTGGDHAQTFNISTAAAFVAAGAGRPRNVAVAKHGNRSVTSKSGSSQVLEALGVKLNVSSDTLTRCLDEAGICFCFAPAHHPAMKYAAPVRGELGFRTIFNVLGPLTNPAGAQRQVVGVYSDELTEPIGHVLNALGAKHAMVVHGWLTADRAGPRIDEISTSGPSRITEVRNDHVTTYEVEPEVLGVERCDASELQVADPQTSAAVIQQVLSGETGAARDIVCLNAAAALVVADLALDLREGLAMASEAIDSGTAVAALERLVAVTQRDKT